MGRFPLACFLKSIQMKLRLLYTALSSALLLAPQPGCAQVRTGAAGDTAAPSDLSPLGDNPDIDPNAPQGKRIDSF